MQLVKLIGSFRPFIGLCLVLISFLFGIFFQLTGRYALFMELDMRRRARALTFVGNSLRSLLQNTLWLQHTIFCVVTTIPSCSISSFVFNFALVSFSMFSQSSEIIDDSVS